MTVYVKLINNIPGINASYNDATGQPTSVYIPGDGGIYPVDEAVCALPGFIDQWNAGDIHVYSDAGGTNLLSTLPTPGTTAPATTTAAGTVKMAAAVPDSVASDVATIVANFNTLLANLRTAGILHS